MDKARSSPLKIADASSSSPRNKYENITDEEFKNHLLTGKDKTCFELVYFILNTLHHICHSGYWYCYCQNRSGKCEMCKMPKIFTNFINDIDNNIFNYEFLYFYHTKLTKELLRLINHNRKDCIECFRNEYIFGVKRLLLLFGASLFLKAFDALKKFKLID